MIVKKPAIFIYTSEPDREILREICAGIEEEGVFYEIKEQTLVPKDARSTAARFAWQAAQDSMLGSGIGKKDQVDWDRCADFPSTAALNPIMYRLRRSAGNLAPTAPGRSKKCLLNSIRFI